MKIKRVLLDPDYRLSLPNARVLDPWEDLQPNVKKMFKVMYRTGIGVGMAAPQVGWNVRLFVMNSDNKTYKPAAQRVFWNPEIVETFGEKEKMREGCLSLPKVFGDIMRYPKVHLKAMSPKGGIDEVFSGLAAQIIQHEMGHLSGQMCSELFIKKEGETEHA